MSRTHGKSSNRLFSKGSCPTAPTGYEHKHGNVYYKKHYMHVDQLKAVLKCQEEGTTLAMPKSQDAMTAITSYRSITNQTIILYSILQQFIFLIKFFTFKIILLI